MDKLNTPKKPAPRDWHRADWHRADVVASLRKAGWSLRRLSIHHGYSGGLLKAALARPYPKAERIIAQAIGIEPQRIWPSRYHPDGSPKSGRGERGIGRRTVKSSGAAGICNVENA